MLALGALGGELAIGGIALSTVAVGALDAGLVLLPPNAVSFPSPPPLLVPPTGLFPLPLMHDMTLGEC